MGALYFNLNTQICKGGINMQQLLKEDKDNISKLTREILGKSNSMTYSNFIGHKDNFSKNFVGADISTFEGRKKNEQFSFFTETEVGIALYMFFSSIYNANHIAKNIYMLDEDERFSEEFDVQIPLGQVMLPNGAVMTTSIVEAVLKVRNVEERNPYHGMPFDIISFRLVYD